MPNGIRVRRALRGDTGSLARIEENVWRRHKTLIVSEFELSNWIEEKSPFFLVAEDTHGVHGYYFVRQVQFNPLNYSSFLSGRGFSTADQGYHRHDPLGDCACAVSIASLKPGFGRLLRNSMMSLLRERRILYFLGFSRLPGLFRYLNENREEGLEMVNDMWARWYAYRCATLLGMSTHQSVLETLVGGLPEPRRPDPVLAFHVRNINAVLLGVVSDYMPDPDSLNYGALIMSKIPD